MIIYHQDCAKLRVMNMCVTQMSHILIEIVISQKN